MKIPFPVVIVQVNIGQPIPREGSTSAGFSLLIWVPDIEEQIKIWVVDLLDEESGWILTVGRTVPGKCSMAILSPCLCPSSPMSIALA